MEKKPLKSHPVKFVQMMSSSAHTYGNAVAFIQKREMFSSAPKEVFAIIKPREKELLLFLLKQYPREFTPIEVSREIGVTNKTVINRLAALVKNGFVEPIMVHERIRSYQLSDFAKQNEKKIVQQI